MTHSIEARCAANWITTDKRAALHRHTSALDLAIDVRRDGNAGR
jgi:hypothetical protein